MKDKIRKFLIEQIEQMENWIKISGKEYLELLDKYDDAAIFVYKHLTRNPEDRNKQIFIIGDLDVSNKEINKLTGIGEVSGRLNISNTQISDISGIKYHYLSDYNSPYETKRLKRERQRFLAQAQGRREENEWDINNPDIDEVGIFANAIIGYIDYHEGREHIKTPEDITYLEELNNRMESLLEKEKEYEESGRDTTDIIADIQLIEEQIIKINEKVDVYNLVPVGNDYSLTSFEVMGSEEYEGWKFAVGTTEQADSSLEDYYDEMVNAPTEYFQIEYLENFIDEDEVLDAMREHYEYDVSDSPESHFDDDDFKLSDEQEEEKERLENQLSEYQDELSEYEDRLTNIEDSDSEEYDQVQTHIDSLEELISDIEDKISDIEPDREPTQEMIDDKVDDLMSDVKRNLTSYMEDFGMDVTKYLDTDKLLKSLVANSEYGVLGGWDNSFDEIKVLDEYYVVMITEK